MTTRSHGDADQLLSRAEGAWRIVRVGPERHLEAVQRLLSGRPGGRPGGRAAGRSGLREADRGHAERFIAFSRDNDIRIDAMWARLDDRGAVASSVLAVPSPGRTAMLFVTPPAGAREVPGTAALIDHACGELAEMDVDLAQALLDPHEPLPRDALATGGFTTLAALSYLERPLPGPRDAPPDEPWPDAVTVAPYRPDQRAELMAVLEASYEDTRDCPGLRGLRRTEDILEGHVGTGAFDPDLWTILRVDGVARGCLLLNRSPASNTIELVYIGLARDAQGRGLGRSLLRHGLRRLAGRTERALTLAVDEQNEPALALYRSERFRRVLRRIAMIRPLRAAR